MNEIASNVVHGKSQVPVRHHHHLNHLVQVENISATLDNSALSFPQKQLLSVLFAINLDEFSFNVFIQLSSWASFVSFVSQICL